MSSIGTLYVIGQIIGLPITGYISDLYGRKFTIVIGIGLNGLFGLIKGFSVNYTMFALLEILNAYLAAGNYGSGLILGIFMLLIKIKLLFTNFFYKGMELVGPKYRGFGGIFLHFCYSIGMVILGVMAMLLLNWRILLLSVYFPSVIITIYLYFIPESVRWLISKGRYSEALSFLQKVARFNKNQLSEETFKEFKNLMDGNKTENVVKNSIWEGLQNRQMLIRVLLLSPCRSINCLIYFGMSIFSTSIGQNKFESFIFTTLVELPAVVIAWFLADKFGRIKVQVLSLYGTGIACIALVFLDNKSLEYLVIYLIGKSLITISYTVITIYTVEVFPTTLRNSLYGLCAMFGKLGMVVATQILLLQWIHVKFPMIFFGVAGVLGGSIILFAPESLNMPIHENLDDVIKYEKNKKLVSDLR